MGSNVRRARKVAGGLFGVAILATQAVIGDGPIEPPPTPMRLEPGAVNYSEMESDMPPWPEEQILAGHSEHRYKYLYSGDIDVAIYQAKPMVLQIDNYDIDEFVLVVSGALILTADGGSPQKFVAGESVLVPKGFTGTWEMQGEFRELVVMMRE
tara:strand:- start:566 stop:1027 length:462 start_codon:yes stop_codon:yes gene_type:complete